jgi:predicted MPP superfamily phosphohydrolase
MNRRRFLKRALGCLVAVPVLGAVYGRLEARWLHVVRQTIAVPNLPSSFEGTTVALVADLHHGPWVSLDYIEKVVERTNALSADLIAVPGDFVQGGEEHDCMRACVGAVSRLRAPLGVYATPGNHDYCEHVTPVHQYLDEFGIRDLTNTGLWIERGGERLRVCGTDDMWCGHPDISAALGDAGDEDCSLVLCHNPDYVEKIRDTRASLILSGHTHGGQVWLGPYHGHVPSRYGKKYLAGLVKTPWTQVYVTRGVGVSGPPVRIFCRPEINLLTLTAA